MREPGYDGRLRWKTLNQLEAWLERPMIWLSFAWLALVIIELAWGTSAVFNLLGMGIWFVFIAEFAIRLALAPEKLSFLRSNWLTVIALALPALRMFAALRVFRLARAARGLRLVRVVGSANRGMNALRKSMRRRGVGYALTLTALVTLLGAAGMMASESTTGSIEGLSTYPEAVWWTAMLMTTMGTDFWRVLCLLLAIYSFAMWGYITASIATFFIGQETTKRKTPPAEAGELSSLRSENRALREAVQSLTNNAQA